MEIFLTIAFIALFLVRETLQVHKANKYADQVVKKYNEKKKP